MYSNAYSKCHNVMSICHAVFADELRSLLDNIVVSK